LIIDYLVHGCSSLIPERPPVFDPDRLSALTRGEEVVENPAGAQVQSGAAVNAARQSPATAATSPGLKEVVDTHE
jgi:hypothetical protein